MTSVTEQRDVTPQGAAGTAAPPEAQECQALARRMAAYGEARGWGLARLCREFPALGSDRTLRDMRDGRFEGYDLAARLADLRAAAALVDDLAQEGGEERVFDTLGTVELGHEPRGRGPGPERRREDDGAPRRRREVRAPDCGA